MINYLIEVTLCWALFYGVYLFFLKKETFFELNRYYLLGTLLGGLIIPMLEIAPGTELVQQFQQVILLPEATVTAQIGGPPVEQTIGTTVEQATSIGWSGLLLILYTLALLAMTARLLIGLFQIYQLKRLGTEIPKQNYTRIETTKSHAPFSFFHFLFMNKENDLSTTEQNQIIIHELAHIKGRHSVDVLLVELISVILWFHPLIFLYKRSIKENHEYLADKAVVEVANKQQYSRLLVEQAIPGLRLANNFNHSLLKKRIKMMSTIKSNSYNLLKYSVCLPLIVLVMFLFSCKKDVEGQLQQTEVQKTAKLAESEQGSKVDPEAKAKFLKSISDSYKKNTPEGLEEAKNKWVEFGQYLAKNAEKTKSADGVYIHPEERPLFPGCGPEMSYVERSKCSDELISEFLHKNLAYPEEARNNGKEGMVSVRLIINKEGDLAEPEILKGISESLDEEALRVVRLMPAWIPGKQKGNAVDVEIILPIRFKLNS